MAVELYGIDVSSNNGSINWDQVKAFYPPLGFVYIKATEGVGYRDKNSLINGTGAQRVGIPFGYYHFASINSIDVVADATAEANAFTSALKSLPISTLMPVLDIETNEANLSQQYIAGWIQAFLKQMAANGYPDVMIYSGLYWLNTNLPDGHPFGNLPLWIAEYNSFATPTLPKGWSKYNIWQYSDNGRVNGISGAVDMNKSRPDLIALLKVGGIAVGLTIGLFALFFLGYKFFSK